jgi:hypothetical protein
MKLLLAVYAMVTALFGVLAFVVPPTVISWYSPLPADVIAQTGFRLGGSLGIGLAMLAWYARNSEGKARNAIVLAVILTNALGCIAALIAATSGAFNNAAWFEVISYALWTAAFIVVAQVKKARVTMWNKTGEKRV